MFETETWENDLRARLAQDPSVWSLAEAHALIDLAKRQARTDGALFDWLTQTYTTAGREWIARQVL